MNAGLSALDRRRLRWRARRGLLENDLIVTRFLDRYENELDDEQVVALMRLLDLPDNHLLDLLLARVEPTAPLDTESDLRLLAQLRAA